MGGTCHHSSLYQWLQWFQKKQHNLLGGLEDDADDDDDQGKDNGGVGKKAGNMLIEGEGITPPPSQGVILSQAMVETGVKELPPGLIQMSLIRYDMTKMEEPN